MEIVPGVRQLKVPIPNNPLGNLLAYLIATGEGYVLIDTGWNHPKSFASLEGQLQEQGVAFRDILAILITHRHPDHFGLARRVRELSGAPVFLHRREAASVPESAEAQERYLKGMIDWLLAHGVPQAEVRELEVWRQRIPNMMPSFEADRLLEDNETCRWGSLTLETLWTPGHSPGHLCFYERNRRLLFSGDHILPVITPNVSLRYPDEGNPLQDFVSSLEKVAYLEVSLVLPAHEHIFAHFAQRVQELKQHHQERLQIIQNASRGGWYTARQIAEQVPWNLAPWNQMSFWHRRMAVMETLAHIRYLVTEDRMTERSDNGLYLYQSVA